MGISKNNAELLREKADKYNEEMGRYCGETLYKYLLEDLNKAAEKGLYFIEIVKGDSKYTSLFENNDSSKWIRRYFDKLVESDGFSLEYVAGTYDTEAFIYVSFAKNT